jgi:hypothetical protein
MRLLTHNTLQNNSSSAKGKGYPLRITATEIKVDDYGGMISEQQLDFVKGMLPTLNWEALVKVSPSYA